MHKKQRRRQDEQRVKNKWRKVAKKWAGSENHWIHTWRFLGLDANGKPVNINVIDRSRATKRRKFIEDTAVRRAHHPAHQCEMCREDKNTRLKRLRREAERKAPMFDGKDE